MARVLGNVTGIVLIVLVMHASAWAQATAQLSGAVKDESGAVIAGAQIAMRNWIIRRQSGRPAHVLER